MVTWLLASKRNPQSTCVALRVAQDEESSRQWPSCPPFETEAEESPEGGDLGVSKLKAKEGIGHRRTLSSRVYAKAVRPCSFQWGVASSHAWEEVVHSCNVPAGHPGISVYAWPLANPEPYAG